ncbi:MAG: NAD(P)/FAD-dependent oxidoreductase [Planctomycetota bacterium]|jgi:thioredoxin reductase (NADPH)
MSEDQLYDVIIVGAGPAGFAAGLYAARDRYRTLLLEKNGLAGGQIMLTEKVENYPGYGSVAGPELMSHMQKQVEDFGGELLVNKAATAIRRNDGGILDVEVNGGENTYRARAVILSPGSDYRQLGVPGEEEMRQATRVSYCATCDGAFYRDMHVLAVGGGNTAVEDTIYLATRFTRKITMIHRRREFRATKVLVEELYKTAGEKNIDIKLPYVLEEIVPTGDKKEIDHVRIRNVESDRVEDLKVDGVFIFVGMNPNTQWLGGTVKMNEAGYVAADPATMKTSMPGVFVAGDCRQAAALQLATACSDGVVAAMQIKEYFRDPSTWAKELVEEGPKGW